MPARVYITVDTENSMGGAWANPALKPVTAERHAFCRVGGVDHGIGWMCDELNRRGLQATFFCEVFASECLGDADTLSYFDFLLRNGQDVQLHAHLTYHFYAQARAGGQAVRPYLTVPRTDDLCSLPEGFRAEAVGRACELFARFAGRRPVAFRAGNWHCNRALLTDLAREGIGIDSSYNHAFQGRGSFDGETLTINALQRVGPVWEVPATVARQRLPDPAVPNKFRFLDPTSMSRWEMRAVLEHGCANGIEHIVAVFHSFSAVKTRDLQYSAMRPDRIVKGRFRWLLDYLSRNPGKFSVTTLGELATCAEEPRAPGRGAFAELGFMHPLARKVVQGFNRFYWV
jgi:hypothetical protein